jgi:hypothetical protein
MSTTDDEPQAGATEPGEGAAEPGATTGAATTEAPSDAPSGGNGSSLAARRAADAAASRRSATGSGSPGWMRSLKRYGPFVAVVAIVAGAVAVFGGGGDDSDDRAGGGGAQTTTAAAPEGEDLIRDGPMTPEKAELLGEDVDFGPDCDTTTNRIKLPTIYAPPCVEPFTGDNGGATSMGVTEDEILVVRYEVDPALDPVGASLIQATGAEVNPETARETALDYAAVYQQVYETYGRQVRIVPFSGTGAADDHEAARADAIEIAEMEPFAVVGGPAQASTTFAPVLAENKIVCISPCAGSLPEDIIEENEPYVWLNGPTPNQAAALAAEMVGKLAGPGKASLAGDPSLQEQDRAYAVVHYNTPDGAHTPVFEALRDSLAEQDIDLEVDIEYLLDPSRIQETARTLVARLEASGVTTVIFYGDPLMPDALTTEATAQDYHPEWILGPSVLADTTIFGRSFDQDQWKNGFGIGFNPARGDPETSDDYRIYEWAYGTEPPNNTYNTIGPPLRTLFNGIHLAGENLTPSTFRDGLYRYPPSGGSPTAAHVSRGDHGFWPDGRDDGGADDATIIWWDPTASGEDETGQEGEGMYRYANGGQRYKLGEFPTSAEDAGLFDVDASVTVYETVPAEDTPPDYPPPEL